MVKTFNEWLNESQNSNFKIPQTYNEVKALLEDLKIMNYTINDDLTVDVDDNVNLYGKLNKYRFEYIPIKFKVVTGNFYCANNKLTSLYGLAEGFSCKHFDCSGNIFITLEQLPDDFKCESFSCNYNKELVEFKGLPKGFKCITLEIQDCCLSNFKGLPEEFKCENLLLDENIFTSLKGLPSGIIFSSISFNNNKLKSLIGLPEDFKAIDVYLSGNKINSLEGLPKGVKYDSIYLDGNIVEDDVLSMLATSISTDNLNWEEALMKHFKEIPFDEWNKLGMPIDPSPEFQEWLKTKKGTIASKRLGL